MRQSAYRNHLSLPSPGSKNLSNYCFLAAPCVQQPELTLQVLKYLKYVLKMYPKNNVIPNRDEYVSIVLVLTH